MPKHITEKTYCKAFFILFYSFLFIFYLTRFFGRVLGFGEVLGKLHKLTRKKRKNYSLHVKLVKAYVSRSLSTSYAESTLGFA
tara:strand:- start:74 stop:322 length:249 start_codon:yes stop_codon:yes gene_type:complete